MFALALVRARIELHATCSPAKLAVILVGYNNLRISLFSSSRRGASLEVVAGSFATIAWNVLARLVHHGQLKSVALQSIVTIWIPRSASGFQKNQPYFGAMRIAPSILIVDPFNILFSMMCFTSAAYSSGWPSRLGNGTCSASETSAASGRLPSNGV
jgi:hypothetical protein